MKTIEEQQADIGRALPVSGLLSTLFGQLDSRGVRYCVINNYESLPECVENDVDLLVHPEHRGAFRESLLAVAASSGWMLVKDLSRFGFYSFWLKRHSAAEFLQIDVWTTLHWKGLPLAQTQGVLAECRRYGVLNAPSPAAEAGILLLKGILYEGKLKPKYLAKVTQVAEREGASLETFLSWALSGELAAWLSGRIRAQAWDEIEQSRPRLVRALRLRSLARHPLIALSRMAGFLGGHLRVYLGRRNGMFLVLVGPDGSGKSTIASKLSERLAGLFRYHRYYHGRFGILPRLSSMKGALARLIGRRASTEQEDDTIAEPQQAPHGRVRMLAYIAYYGLDYVLGHLLIRRQEGLGNLVIFDRYFYDWFVQSYASRTPRCLLPLLKLVFPRPDLVVYLYNAPEVVHERKPELTVAQIAEQEARFKSVLERVPQSTVIHTDLSVDTIVSQIADEVARKMAAGLQ